MLMELMEDISNNTEQQVLSSTKTMSTQIVIHVTFRGGWKKYYVINIEDLDNIRNGEFALNRIFIGTNIVKRYYLKAIKPWWSKSYKVALDDTPKKKWFQHYQSVVYVVDKKDVDIQVHDMVEIVPIFGADLFQNVYFAKEIGGMKLVHDYLKGKFIHKDKQGI